MKKIDLTKGVVSSTEWIARLAILNLIWLLFSIPIVTIFPATNTLFYILHLWANGETTGSILKTFWTHFKAHFWTGYKVGLPIFILLLILFIDRWFLEQLSSQAGWIQIYQYVLYFLTILFCLTALFYVTLTKIVQLPLRKQFLTSFFLMIGHPLISFGLLLTVMVLLFIFSRWPALLFFFSGSGIGWAATLATKKAVSKTIQKQQT